MAISSIHIEAGKIGFFSHNSREKETSNAIFNDEENFCSCDFKTAVTTFRAELKTRTKVYIKNHPTRTKLHAKTLTHLSAIVNFNKEHTPDDIKKICDYLENTLDTKVIQYSMHRDEGHIIEDEIKSIHDSIDVDTKIKNYHAHIEFMGLDSKGGSVRRKIDKPFLKQLQTDVAKILNMQRGHESGYNKKQYLEITAKLKPQDEYKNKKEYRDEFNKVAKDLGYFKEKPKAKRKDTYAYKEYMEDVSKAVKASTKDLKKEVAKLRAELQARGAKREDYAKLEATVKVLKEQIKSKDLTIDDLNKALQGKKSIQDELDHTKVMLKASNQDNKALTVKNEKQLKSMDNINQIYFNGRKELGVKQELTFRKFFVWVKEKFTEFKDEISKLYQEIQVLKTENDKLKNEAMKSTYSSELNVDGSHALHVTSDESLSEFNKKSTEKESQKENLKRIDDDPQIPDDNIDTDSVVTNNNSNKKKNRK